MLRLFLASALAVAVAACTGASAADCDERIGGVRAGVCIPPPDERPAAPGTTTAPVLGEQRELSLDDFRGQVVVLNFWGSWCGPCRAEQPDLNQAYEALEGRDVAFLGVNVDDTVPNATAHEREFAMPYPSLFDPSYEYTAQFEGVGPRSVPSTLLIDKQGRIAARLFGQLLGPQEVLALVERLVGEHG